MNDPIKTTYTLFNAFRVLPESRSVLQISQVPLVEKYTEEAGEKKLAILNVFEIATIDFDDNLRIGGRLLLSRDSIPALIEMLVEALKESKE